MGVMSGLGLIEEKNLDVARMNAQCFLLFFSYLCVCVCVCGRCFGHQGTVVFSLAM